MFDDLFSRFVTYLSDDDKRSFSIASLLNPTLMDFQWVGCQRSRPQAVAYFMMEYNSNWAPDPSAADEPEPVAPVVPTGPGVRTAAIPGFIGTDMDFLISVAATMADPMAQQPPPYPPTPLPTKSEAELYLEHDHQAKFTCAKDLLLWWKVHESTYPHLAMMARQFLGCPATSASVERIFSVAGQLFDDLRRNLDDGRLEEMMWACINNGGSK